LIKAIIFDFDGVLVESTEIKTEAFKQIFQNYPAYIDEIVEYHEENMGISRFIKFKHIYNNIIHLPISQEQEEDLGKTFSQIVLEKILSASFASGAMEFLQEYYKDYFMFVASGTPEEELHFIIKNRGIEEYFIETHGTPRKKPEIINDILKRYHWNPQEAIFVGDAETDLSAANETGIHFVARIAKWRNKTFDCTYCIDNLSDLGMILKKLSKY
jgi:HAD superfamily hydrolase (TIGR01509 family)